MEAVCTKIHIKTELRVEKKRVLYDFSPKIALITLENLLLVRKIIQNAANRWTCTKPLQVERLEAL